jgi:hypothetical protein
VTEFILGAASAVIAALFATSIGGWLDRISRSILNRATRRLPERYVEEFSADFNSIATTQRRFFFAIGILRASRRIREAASTRTEEHSDADPAQFGRRYWVLAVVPIALATGATAVGLLVVFLRQDITINTYLLVGTTLISVILSLSIAFLSTRTLNRQRRSERHN